MCSASGHFTTHVSNNWLKSFLSFYICCVSSFEVLSCRQFSYSHLFFFLNVAVFLSYYFSHTPLNTENTSNSTLHYIPLMCFTFFLLLLLCELPGGTFDPVRETSFHLLLLFLLQFLFFFFFFILHICV